MKWVKQGSDYRLGGPLGFCTSQYLKAGLEINTSAPAHGCRIIWQAGINWGRQPVHFNVNNYYLIAQLQTAMMKFLIYTPEKSM